MALPILLLLQLAAAVYIAKHVYTLQRNVRAARASGIPYAVLPFQPHSIPAQILFPLWGPVVHGLPRALQGKWTSFMYQDVHWTRLYAPFRETGSDTVLAVSPGAVILHTAEAEVIGQVTERRADFPKPTWIYDIIDIYGKSAISVEGALWRKHRKVTSVPFTEKNNHLVWTESIFQTGAMLRHTVLEGKDESATIADVEHLTSRIALAIISKAGYGIRMAWDEDGNSHEDIPGLGADWVQGRTNGHSMSYASAIFAVTTHILWLMLCPHWLLRRLPLASARTAWSGYANWGQYMREMVAAKRAELDGQESKARGTDLLAALVQSARTHSTESKADGFFSDDELLGNAFLLIVAGHETTAGVLCVGLMLLAMHSDAQAELQAELDEVLGSEAPEQWTYEEHHARLAAGRTGAVLAEVLRWMPPVPSIPKFAHEPQTLNVAGQPCSVPRGTILTINVPAAHRNPHQWPCGGRGQSKLELAASNPDDDLGQFKPARWLEEGESEHGLFKPQRGAFVPFSEGSRACLGRRFGQVEVVAMLATIFQNHSVELAVDEWATDAQVDVMDPAERHAVWTKARDAAQHNFRYCMQNLMTNRMTRGHVPIRIVRRGKERFR